MTSTWEQVCDAAEADLKANIPRLSDATVHKLAAWDPEELFAQEGERHLGIWPEGEGEVSVPITTNSTELRQGYLIVVWESAGAEETRLVLDYPATQALMELQESVRTRILSWTRARPVAGLNFRYESVTFPPSVRGVRYFAARFSVGVAANY